MKCKASIWKIHVILLWPVGRRADQCVDVRGTFLREEHVKMYALNGISTKDAKLLNDLGFSFLCFVYMHLIIITSSLPNFKRSVLCMENLIVSMPCRCAHLSSICISRFQCS